jgi:uncharacterized membrane protein
MSGENALGAHAPSSAVLSRRLALASLIALIVLGLAWELWLAPTGRGTLAIKVLPLALALPGLWKSRLYTFRWLSLLVWLYVAEGLVRATSEAAPGSLLAIAEVVLGVALFAACGWHVRARLADAKRGA